LLVGEDAEWAESGWWFVEVKRSQSRKATMGRTRKRKGGEGRERENRKEDEGGAKRLANSFALFTFFITCLFRSWPLVRHGRRGCYPLRPLP
jgi:hypothetical protein